MAKKPPEETLNDMIVKSAPAFALPDQDGEIHVLSNYTGEHVVLFWYPKDDTPSFAFTQ